ncbi:thioredoxin-like domain-containing protein [Thermomicrobium sp. CFH 73360]|uniref:thioredoxin-like domain-containing protein n=1 Tax=Thermomicrobium sp. CFH 73360 TaxID=2951987 RepID=UPI00336BCB0D
MNCLHVLPALRAVEERYPAQVVVIGVHSPKFPNEREPANVRQAILREDITHPVVHDPELLLWRRYAVRAWPTLVFVGPDGRILGVHEGEIPVESLVRAVAQLLARAGVTAASPLDFLAPEQRPRTPLAFPGKLAVSEARDRLVVSDTGHHRLVVAALDGTVYQVIGDGTPGLRDGSLDEARFCEPQGVFLYGDFCFVADRGNHAIRRVDLARGVVETIAGTGRLGHGFPSAGPARQLDLRSPWALWYRDGFLFVAMAGSHQIWALDLATGLFQPYAGSGMEGIQGGPLDRAWFAQPSGLTSNGHILYVACPEASAVRTVDLPGTPNPKVGRLVGTGLFDFGDRDGTGDAVRLQHPLDVAWSGGELLVADTYNHKVKRLDPTTRTCMTWAGDGHPGHEDGPLERTRFWEPGGLAVAGDRVFVADTNQHAVRVIDHVRGVVETLELRGLMPPGS